MDQRGHGFVCCLHPSDKDSLVSVVQFLACCVPVDQVGDPCFRIQVEKFHGHLTLYRSSKQVRASGALGLNMSGRYFSAKERLEAK